MSILIYHNMNWKKKFVSIKKLLHEKVKVYRRYDGGKSAKNAKKHARADAYFVIKISKKF